MLRELRIRNFVVVEELRLEFGAGLSVLSGETGAGKSIVVEALALLVGGRPSADMIRAGAPRALVEARFDVRGLVDIEATCDDAGVDLEDGWIILRRELRREGRHRAWVNGSPSTTALLKRIGVDLIDIHGQHEHQRLLDRGEQRRVLDAFGGQGDLAEDAAHRWDEMVEIEGRLEDVRARARAGIERADYLRFKAEEIEAAALEEDEEVRLETDARRLSHSEELLEIASTLYHELYESEGSIVERLGQAGGRLEGLASIDASSRRFIELYEPALRGIEELGRELAAYRDGVEHDPARLDEIRERQDALYRLKRKYGDSLTAVLEAGRAARAELDGIEGADDAIRALERERAEVAAVFHDRVAKLTKSRRKAAKRLESAVNEMLPKLGLEGGRLEVKLTPLDAPARSGGERIDLLVSLNPGFPPAPLTRVASGGELSRLMLALQTALVRVEEAPVLIFDEVDAGVGGRVAHQVAEQLRVVADRHQVVVVTHLAQIAARADEHYSVGKIADRDETRTEVRALTEDERVVEVARMLGGDPGSDASRAHAEELLAGRV
ncbi:MAG: DNA repair protein RecN [Gemmatimonadetes bacterium]|nr:DNA repair protein RecN [Gemmatimonadota bacterium]